MEMKEVEIDIRQIILKVWKGRFIIFLCVAISVGVSFVKQLPEVPIYQIETLLNVKQEANAFLGIGIGGIAGGVGGGESFVKSLMTSNYALSKVVKRFNLQILYEKQDGLFKKREIYDDAPFYVECDSLSPQMINVPFKVNVLKGGRFKLSIELQKGVTLFDYVSKKMLSKTGFEKIEKIYSFGQQVKTPHFNFKIVSRDFVGLNPKNEYLFTFMNEFSIIDELSNAIDVVVPHGYSGILKVSIEIKHRKKGVDILNSLVRVLQEYEIDQKNIPSNYSIDFIDKRMISTLDSLTFFEKKIEKFRIDNGLLNIDSRSAYISNRLVALDVQKRQLKQKQDYIDYLRKYIINASDGELMAPSLSGVTEPTILEIYNRLSSLNDKFIENKFGSKEGTPYRFELKKLMEQSRFKFLHNIKEVDDFNQIVLKQLKRETEHWEGELERVPNMQQRLVNIQRFYSILEEQYVFLLKKRANLGLIRSNNLQDTRIIDPAIDKYQSPINDGLKKVLLLAFVTGLAAGVAIIIIKEMTLTLIYGSRK